MSQILRRTVAALVLTLGFLLVGVGPARAATGGTVTVDGTTLLYAAAPGVANTIDISYEPALDVYYVQELAGTIEATGESCLQESEAKVACDAAGLTAIKADAGDMFDILGVRGTLSPEVADVELRGGPGDDYVSGGPAGEKLYGGGDNDLLEGYGGDDTIVGGPGDDVMRGGAGIDTVSYFDQFSPVTADADGMVGDDGPSGQDDTIMPDVENIVGGKAGDSLYGGQGYDGLDGGPGDDLLVGGAGSDRLYGGDGFDLLYGDGAGTSPRDVDVCVAGPGGGLTNGCEVVL